MFNKIVVEKKSTLCRNASNRRRRPSFVLESEFMLLCRERFYVDDKKSWQDDTASNYIFSEQTYIHTHRNKHHFSSVLFNSRAARKCIFMAGKQGGSQ